jgi:hypothetical protein
MAGSRSNPGQTVTRARGRFGTTSFGSQRRLCPAYLLARIFILTGELLAHNATVTRFKSGDCHPFFVHTGARCRNVLDAPRRYPRAAVSA